MILSKYTIQKLINEKKIGVNPLSQNSLSSVAIDLHLDSSALNPDNSKEVNLQDFHLTSDEFYLAHTVEFIELPANIVARIVARSSVARLGVLVTFDADILPPNYSGKPLLTLKNLSRKPVLLKPGLAVAQIMFEEVDQEVDGYKSRYNHEKIEESKLCEEME